MATQRTEAEPKPTKVRLLHRIGGAACAIGLPAATHLWDLKIGHYDLSSDPARPEYNEHCIFVFWHEYIGSVLPRWGQTPLTLLVSQHRDAEILNQMALCLGLNIVRGSTTRGGSKAIRELKRYSKFSSIAIAPDGPKGPRREMAMGAIYLASLLKMPIVPVGVGCDRPKRLGTWDKFAIPRPFSRVRVIFGPKYYLPPRTKKKDLEGFRILTKNRLNQVTTFAEEWAESGQKLDNEKSFRRGHRTGRMLLPESTPPVEIQRQLLRAA
ncbi:lysophospholipid acyltransferase family protein [bacterium]|nr:lysophospholipid acyltransferase family protein [bacterium]